MDSLSQHSKLFSVFYHDIFDFPLTKKEISKWRMRNIENFKNKKKKVIFKNGFYFLEGREGIIEKRQTNKMHSQQKIKIAKSAAELLKKIPTIQMVALTGSLAMDNAKQPSDIDLMIITRRGSLWTTRLITYLLLAINNYKLRRAGDKNEKDMLCLNMWLDEEDLLIQKRNHFNAHEIVQILPLVSKERTYERFIWKNRWVLDYWPNAIQPKKIGNNLKTNKLIFEPLAYLVQYLYMRGKITKETISPTRAFFHPFDWSFLVSSKIKPT